MPLGVLWPPGLGVSDCWDQTAKRRRRRAVAVRQPRAGLPQLIRAAAGPYLILDKTIPSPGLLTPVAAKSKLSRKRGFPEPEAFRLQGLGASVLRRGDQRDAIDARMK